MSGQVIGPEYWWARGIGSEWNLSCLVTGEQRDLMPNVSGFVVSRDAGERVVAMFGGRARPDYREREPNWIQVKVGALPEHEAVLVRLCDASQALGGVITPSMITWARDPVLSPGYEPLALRYHRELDGIAALLSAIVTERARWEFFTGDRKRGEVCVGGLRHSTSLDPSGCPIVTDSIRAVLSGEPRS